MSHASPKLDSDGKRVRLGVKYMYGACRDPLTAAERVRRTQVYEEALASVRLEGFELDEQVKELYGRYISEELTLAEVGSAIDELDAREFGPVRAARTSQWRP
jgi:hypothetical protein